MTKLSNSFSYTFSGSGAKALKMETELFAMDQWIDFRLPGDQVLARNPSNGREMVLPLEVLNAMSYCREFRSMQEHIAVLMEGLDDDPARAAAIESVVKSVRDGGMTVSARDICRALAPAGSAAPISEKPVVAVISCERPQALERLLDSILDNCKLDSIDGCFVVDDSRSPQSQDRNREIAEVADQKASARIRYFGAAESRELVSDLISRLPRHEEAIRFLLDRERWKDQKSYGVARNYSHLLSIGKPVVVFDDDTICEVFEAPLTESGVEISNRQRDSVFYAKNGEWQELRAAGNQDPVARHMQCLGLTVPEALTVLGIPRLDQEALRLATPDLAREVTAHSRVLITECGALGDPGTGNNCWIAGMTDESRDRLLSEDGRLQLALEQRCCWLGRARPVFGPRGNISQVTGFDNRRFLPPYFPITRGEDQLFGHMTRHIYPDSVVLDYPWAVPHLPMSQRGWSDQERNFTHQAHFPKNLKEQVAHIKGECLSEDPHSRLEYLAQFYIDMAESPDEALLNRFANDWHVIRASQLRGIEKKVQESTDLPQEWREYVERAFEQIQSSSLGTLSIEGLDGGSGMLKGKELASFWRKAWRSFGQSLLAWSDIREAAHEINAGKFDD
jgi:hypothetical protein